MYNNKYKYIMKLFIYSEQKYSKNSKDILTSFQFLNSKNFGFFNRFQKNYTTFLKLHFKQIYNLQYFISLCFYKILFCIQFF